MNSTSFPSPPALQLSGSLVPYLPANVTVPLMPLQLRGAGSLANEPDDGFVDSPGLTVKSPSAVHDIDSATTGVDTPGTAQATTIIAPKMTRRASLVEAMLLSRSAPAQACVSSDLHKGLHRSDTWSDLSISTRISLSRVELGTVRAARIVGAVLGVLAAVGGIPAADAVTPAVTAPLAYGGDFPDPFVFVNGGRYYAYSTQIWSGDRWTNVPVMSSTNLASWSTIKDALPTLPAWARPGNTWAPGVIRRSGRYLLYYTTTQATTGRQCISVATASTPTGPFRDRSNGPLVCQLSQGGSIDPTRSSTPPAGCTCSGRATTTRSARRRPCGPAG